MKSTLMGLAFASISVSLAACGGPSPSIANLSLDRMNVTRGIEAYAIVAYHAPLGDLDKGEVKIKATTKVNDTEVETHVPVMGVDHGVVDGTMIVEFTLNGDFPLARYDLTIVLKTNEGHESEPKSTPFVLSAPPS